MEQLSSSMQEAIMAAMAEEDEYLPSNESFALDEIAEIAEYVPEAESVEGEGETKIVSEVDEELQELMKAVSENTRLKTEVEELKLTWEKHIERTLQKQGMALPEKPVEPPKPAPEGTPRTTVAEKLKELREENANLTMTQRNLKERWETTEALLLEEQAREAQRKKETESEWSLGFSGLSFGRPSFGSLLGGILKKETAPQKEKETPLPTPSEDPAEEDLEEEELPPLSIVLAEPDPLPPPPPSTAGPPGFVIPTTLPVHHGPVDMLTRGFFGRTWKIYYFILYENRVDCFYNINDAQAHIDYTGNKYGPRRKSRSVEGGDSADSDNSSRRGSNSCSDSGSRRRSSSSGSSRSDGSSSSGSSSSNSSGGSSSSGRRNSSSGSSGSSGGSGESSSSSGDSGSSCNSEGESLDNRRKNSKESESKQSNEEEVDLAFLQTSSIHLPPPEFCIVLDQKGVSVRIENYQEHGVSFGRGFQLFLPSVSYQLCTEDVAATEKWLQVLSKAIYGDEVELDSEQDD